MLVVVTPPLDTERCYRAVAGRDARFDGWFFTAVRTTGIYCRPSCPARTPLARNVSFFTTAAAAQGAGYRACRRCRPDAVPGSPEWDVRADVVARAMRLIADGEVERSGVPGLAARLGYSERQLHRLLVAELGVGPLALARAQRAQTARILVETTDLPMAHVAFAAGFASIRQFNDTVRTVFATTPTELRRACEHHTEAAPGSIALRLPYRSPLDVSGLLRFLGDRAVAGVEEFVDGGYRRTLRLPLGVGIVELSDGVDHVRCVLRLNDLRDLGAAVQRCRRLLDLDADPVAVADLLGADPVLAPLVRRAPGRRVPWTVDGDELAVRAVLGQQVSVAGARTLAGRMVSRLGRPLAEPDGGLTHLFPKPAAIADADPVSLAMPAARRDALRDLARVLASGEVCLDPCADRVEVERGLLAMREIGPWTASYVAMRALGDTDAFLPTDLGVRRAISGLGHASDPASIAELAERWRPWRAYATQRLWASLENVPARASRTTKKGAVA
jgi:AraC family transcriptional regulator, regulatory protein of adaptative response / DNA-3-methyladenine glycosylase II